MAIIVAAPKFYTIESDSCPGYCITQQGSRVVLQAKDALNPFQLWYRDDLWECHDDNFRAAVFINHGSKKALKSQPTSSSRPIAKVTVGVYDPVVEDDTLLWSVLERSNRPAVIKKAKGPSVALSHCDCGSDCKGCDSVSVITTGITDNPTYWKIVAYEPLHNVKIICRWYDQNLTWKEQNVDVTFTSATKKNDETNVVAVHPNNSSRDGMIWYKVPAGGRDDTTFFSSFVLINTFTGLALKGSSKPGDKVLLTQYDPLDYNFVWSENRYQNSNQDSLAINLDGTTLQWSLQNNDQYQNSAWYHPMTLRPASANQTFVLQQAWKFDPIIQVKEADV